MAAAKIPLEILRNILEQAVLVRDLKRSLRLRLVSKLWKSEVEEAVCVTGVVHLGLGLTVPSRLRSICSKAKDPQFCETYSSAEQSAASSKMRWTVEQLCLKRGLSNDEKTRRTVMADLFMCCNFDDRYDVAPRFEGCNNLLAAAAHMGFLDVVKAVVDEIRRMGTHRPGEHEPHVLEEGSNFGSPYRVAARKGHYDIVDYLLRNGLSFAYDRLSYNHEEAMLDILEEAARSCDSRMLQCALEALAPLYQSVSVPDYGPIASLDSEIASTGMTGKDVYVQLWDLNGPVRADNPAFNDAGRRRSPPVLFEGVKETISITQRLLGGEETNRLATATLVEKMEMYLKHACRWGTPDLVRLLLANHVRPTDDDLENALLRGQVVMSSLLIDHGATLHDFVPTWIYSSNIGSTTRVQVPSPVIGAVLLEHNGMLRLLHGIVPVANFKRPEVSGLALKLAAENGLESMVEWLLKEGVPLHGSSCGLGPGLETFQADEDMLCFLARATGKPVAELKEYQECWHC